jgi:regulator of protease activity HflC (stomatin/prohibitin superfamily)
VLIAQLASYGIDDYRFAAIQLAETTLRSVIGQTDLDKSYKARPIINKKSAGRCRKRPSLGA